MIYAFYCFSIPDLHVWFCEKKSDFVNTISSSLLQCHLTLPPQIQKLPFVIVEYNYIILDTSTLYIVHTSKILTTVLPCREKGNVTINKVAGKYPIDLQLFIISYTQVLIYVFHHVQKKSLITIYKEKMKYWKTGPRTYFCIIML
jgi:hypothetical protein